MVSKPGTVQYYLTDLYRGNILNANYRAVGSSGAVFDWMKTSAGPTLYPVTDYTGRPLDAEERLKIGGGGRVVGGIRVRQLRSVEQKCESIPKDLTFIGTKEVDCGTQYSYYTADKKGFYAAGSKEHGALENFTQPFEHRDVVSLLEQGGNFGSYPLGGYIHDFVPNVSPPKLAEELSKCRPLIKESIFNCMKPR